MPSHAVGLAHVQNTPGSASQPVRSLRRHFRPRKSAESSERWPPICLSRLSARTTPNRPAPSLRARCNGTKQTVFLAIRAGGEKNFVRTKIRTPCSVAANTKAPQPVDDDCLPMGVAHLADKLAGSRIVGVDVTVTEVSNQQLIDQCPEARGREGHAPRKIKLAMLNEPVEATHHQDRRC